MATHPATTKQWQLQHKPTSWPIPGSGADTTFRLVDAPLPAQPAPSQAIAKVLAVSNDPAQRTWISPNIDAARLYAPPVNEGDVMRAFALVEIVASGDTTRLPVGQMALARPGGWTQYLVYNFDQFVPVQPLPRGLAATHYLGALGGTGLTAWFGLSSIVKAGPDDVVLVSGAAGATGSMVVQIAKHVLGCKRVVGIAGGAAKCKWVESIGADVCLDYKAPDLERRVAEATPDYVNVYWDNVGGEFLDYMLTRMARFSRIAACGAVSQYNRDGTPVGIKNWFEIVSNRISVLGFIVTDFAERFPEGIKALREAVEKGQIKLGDENETVVPTKFEDVPQTWLRLFEEGGKQGKLITKLE